MGVQHIDLVVSSIERSLPFYRELLAPLGYHRISEVEGERGEGIWYLSGPGVAIGLREAQSEGEHDRYSVGVHHIAPPGWSSAAPRSRAVPRSTPTSRGTTRCSSSTRTG
jgi:catechol 2,3-dioxygenase-like lactoylglutathione lyase family enzyme